MPDDIVLLKETDYISDSRETINDNFLALENRIASIPAGPQGIQGIQGPQGFRGQQGPRGQDGAARATIVLGSIDTVQVGSDVCLPYVITTPGVPQFFYMKAKFPPVSGFFQIDILVSSDITSTATWSSIFRVGNLPTIPAGSTDWIVMNTFFPGLVFSPGQQLRVDVLFANNAQAVIGELTWKV